MNSVSLSKTESVQRAFIAQVYAWMTFALLVTALVAWQVVNSPNLLEAIVKNQFVFYGLIIGEVLLVILLNKIINRISSGVATFLFFVYALLNGATLSVIFLMYTSSSIATTFLITAGTFGAMSLYGFMTKRDLTSIGNLCFMALIGLLIASVVNIFFNNDLLYWITTYAGILIFVGLTAYDTQKIKQIQAESLGDEGTERKVAILGALTLYLDFINLFLYLLRLFGRRR